MGAYLRAEPLLRPLLLLLKTWAAARQINDRSAGTLSSFALTLMAIHLLQRRGYLKRSVVCHRYFINHRISNCVLVLLSLSIVLVCESADAHSTSALCAWFVLARRNRLPSLQELAREEPEHLVQGLDCRFCRDERRIAAALRPQGEERLGKELLDFYRFFGEEYKGGLLGVRGQAAQSSGRFLFVENPFEPGKDVANAGALWGGGSGGQVEVGQHLRLREEFRKAYQHLRRGGPLEERLVWSWFGGISRSSARKKQCGRELWV